MTSFVNVVGLIILCTHTCLDVNALTTEYATEMGIRLEFNDDGSLNRQIAEAFINAKCTDDQQHFIKDDTNKDATTHLAEGSDYKYCSGACKLDEPITFQDASTEAIIATTSNTATCAKANPENQKLIKSIFSNIMEVQCEYINHKAYQIDYRSTATLVLTCPYLDALKTEYATEMKIRLDFNTDGSLKRQTVCSSSQLIQAVRDFKSIYEGGCIDGSYAMLFELNWNKTTIIAAVIVAVLFIAFTLGVACCIKNVMGCCMHKVYTYKRVEFDSNGVTDIDEEEVLVK